MSGCQPPALDFAEPRPGPSQPHESVVVRPGDTLVVRFARAIRPDDAKMLRKLLRDRLPQGAEVMLVIADQLGVVRAEDAQDH